MKPGSRSGLGPEKTPLSFHVDLDKGAFAETFFLTYFYIVGLGQFLILVRMALDEINQAYSEGLRDY